MKFWIFLLMMPVIIFSQKQPNKNKQTPQNVGYQINIQTQNLEGKTLYLSIYKGNIKTTFKVDSAKITKPNELITFSQSKKIIPHIALLSIKNNNSKINLALDNGSKINLNLANEFVDQVITNHPVNKDFIEFQKKNVSADKNKSLENLVKKFPNSIVALYSKFELRKNYSNEISKDKKGIIHYLNDIDFNHKSIQLLPNIYSYLNTYFTLLPVNNENYQYAADQLLQKQNCTSPNYFFYLDWIFKNLEFNESKNLLATTDYIFNRYVNQTKCLEVNRHFYDLTNLKIQKLKSLPLNSKFPELSVVNLKNEEKTISKLYSGKKTFIMFFDPTCDHCKKEAPEVAKFLSELEQNSGQMINKITFLNVENKTGWEDFILKAGLQNWENITVADKSLDLYRKLSLVTNPYYVVLDQDGTIVSKNYNKEYLKNFFKK